MIIREEIEINIGWAADNPKLFEASWKNFFEEHSEKYEISARVTKGFVTLVAVLKE